MIFDQTLISFFVGSSLGIVYGLSFDKYQRRVFTSSPKKIHGLTNAIRLLATRLLLLGICLRYLLHLPTIHFILVAVSFVISFWLAIFNKKAYAHDKC